MIDRLIKNDSILMANIVINMMIMSFTFVPAIIVSERVSHFLNGGFLILEWSSSCALYIMFNYLYPLSLATHTCIGKRLVACMYGHTQEKAI